MPVQIEENGKTNRDSKFSESFQNIFKTSYEYFLGVLTSYLAIEALTRKIGTHRAFYPNTARNNAILTYLDRKTLTEMNG